MNSINFTKQTFVHEKSIQYILINDDPWFKAKEVAEILEYKNPQKAIRDHVDEEDRKRLQHLKGVNETILPLNNEQGHQVMINESGLYSLILRSRKKEAKAFKRWVTSIVLPSIRRTGKYEVQKKIDLLQEQLAACAQTINNLTSNKISKETYINPLSFKLCEEKDIYDDSSDDSDEPGYRR